MKSEEFATAMKIKRVWGMYYGDSDSFHRSPLPDVSRTLKAEKFDASALIEYDNEEDEG